MATETIKKSVNPRYCICRYHIPIYECIQIKRFVCVACSNMLLIHSNMLQFTVYVMYHYIDCSVLKRVKACANICDASKPKGWSQLDVINRYRNILFLFSLNKKRKKRRTLQIICNVKQTVVKIRVFQNSLLVLKIQFTLRIL